MTMRIKNTKLLAVALATTLSLVGCGKKADTSSEANKTPASQPETQNKDLPVYTVAMNLNYPPFEFISDDGGITGFDVDLLNAIAEKEKFAVRYEPYDFHSIIDSVASGEEDMSASSIFIAPERGEVVDYSQAYFTMPIYFVGLEKPGRPQTVEDIKDSTIALEPGNFILKKVVEESFVPQNNQIHPTESNYLAFADMVHGKADLMIENIMTINDYSELVKGQELFYLRLPDEYSIQLGYITQKGNKELVDKLNHGIQTIKADGTYDKVYNKWFGKLEHTVETRMGENQSSATN